MRKLLSKNEKKESMMKNEELWCFGKNTENLDKELNRPVHEKVVISDKSCSFYSIQTLTNLKYLVSSMIMFHCQRNNALSLEQEIVSI